MDPLHDLRIANRATRGNNRDFAVRAFKFAFVALLGIAALSFVPNAPWPLSLLRGFGLSLAVRVALVCGAMALLAFGDSRKPRNMFDRRSAVPTKLIVALLLVAAVAVGSFFLQ